MLRTLLAAVAIAAMLVVPVATAKPKGKPCPKLCRTDLKSCRASCEGTRKQKQQCRRGCKIGLLAICRSFPEPATCLPPTGACGPAPLTCAYLQIALRLNTSVTLPTDFPAPPADATYCGGLAESNSAGSVAVVFYSTSLDTDALATHYAAGFGANSYTFVESPENIADDRVSCDRSFTVERDNVVKGGLYSFAHESAYAVVSGNAATPPVKR